MTWTEREGVLVPTEMAEEDAAGRGPLDPFWYSGPAVRSSAGITVTPDSSLQMLAVFACVRVLAETLGSLPVRVYEHITRSGRAAKRVAVEHPLYDIIGRQPNSWQTSQELHEMAVAHVCLRGNFYGETIPGRRGAVDQIIPRHPDRIKVELLENNTLRYTHYPLSGEPRDIPHYRMWHVRLFSLDGIVGVSPTTYARNAIGLAAAQERHGASGFRNGMIPPYYIKRPVGKWTEQARKNFRSSWRGMHAGSDNAGNVPLMEDGMELVSLGMTNEDSQWLEARNFQAVEIAGIHRVPFFMIHDRERPTFAGISEQLRAFQLLTMLSWYRRFEQTAGRDLLSEPERFFIKYDNRELLRGDPDKQAENARTYFGLGVYSTNDILEILDRNPIGEEGDQRFVMGNNYVPLDADARERQAQGSGNQSQRDDGATAAAMLDGIIADAASRIVRAECRLIESRADKAEDDRDRFCEWSRLAYEKHRSYVSKTLAPIVKASGRGNARDIAKAWCLVQQQELWAATDVASVIAAWRDEKSDQLAAFILEQVNDA